MKQPDRTLVAALDPFMTAHGFKYVKSREVYFRKTLSGFDDFSWSSYPLATGEKWEAGYYEGHYGVGKRNDQVAALLAAVHPNYGDKYHPTVYRGVGNPHGQWFAFDSLRDQGLCLRFDHLEEDVAGTVGRIEAMLEADGFAWYERYADPVALSRDINQPIDLLAGPHCLMNNSEKRPLVGIAAACVGEPERVGDLIDGYLAQARKIDELAAGKRKEPFVVTLEKQLGLIVEKAQGLGYAVKARYGGSFAVSAHRNLAR